MGCASSTGEAKDKVKSNGNARSGAGGGAAGADGAVPEPPAPKQNPYISLTPKDVFSLKASWKAIRRGLEETGLTMFIKMFEQNEGLKQYFEKFKNVDNATLFKSDALKEHATAVMEWLDTIVTELDNADQTHAKLKKQGEIHKKRGIPDEALKAMRDPFLKAVDETLGDRFTDRMRTIYETFIDYVIKTLIEGYA